MLLVLAAIGGIDRRNHMEEKLFPLGVRRDGSYYTRIEWASHTESDPCFWVGNVIDDDTQRNGGTWGANTMGPADVVLSFFGETQKISVSWKSWRRLLTSMVAKQMNLCS